MVPNSNCKIQPCRNIRANKSRYLFIDWKSPDQSKIQARSITQLSMKSARDLNPHDSNSLFFSFSNLQCFGISWDFQGYLAISWDFQGFITRFSVTCAARLLPQYRDITTRQQSPASASGGLGAHNYSPSSVGPLCRHPSCRFDSVGLLLAGGSLPADIHPC